ncbi:unnamed protein product [Strongylus vulgaris]|uniref:Uncharacterized protein n=1 Tax=Strongylus vulgaris TaxID=40348 RepID=A0A3P7JDJ3_STRVU|nr:unnamed protein product [Strongylus vulgaris]
MSMVSAITGRVALLDREGRCHRCLDRHKNSCSETFIPTVRKWARSDFDHRAGICAQPDEGNRSRQCSRELEDRIEKCKTELREIGDTID